MIKVGDYIRFKDSFKDEYWYTTESYMVVGVRVQRPNFITYRLDRRYPPHGRSRCICTFPDRIYLDVTKTREEKINSIFNG